MSISASRCLRAIFACFCLAVALVANAAPRVAAPAATATIEQAVLDRFAVAPETAFWLVLRERADLSHAQYITDWH